VGDYLKIAADRVRGRTAPVIQPRIPSLFEPPTAALSARFTRFPATPATPEQQPSLTSEHSVEPARTQIPEAQKSLPTIQPTSRETLPPIELAQDDRLNNRETVQAPTPRSQRPKADSLQPAISSFDQHEEIITPAVSLPARIIRSVAAQNKEAQPPTRVEPTPVNNPVPAPRSETKQEIHSRTVERQIERSVVKEVMERVRRVQTAQAPIRPANAAVGPIRAVQGFHETGFLTNDSVDDSRPVINVVIGRVSVNAVTERPAAVAKPKQPAGPILSLDRYLEQRKGHS
jgi:hypothetical protein